MAGSDALAHQSSGQTPQVCGLHQVLDGRYPRLRGSLKGILPAGITGKDMIVALCGLFNKDEVLNHAIEFTVPSDTLKSLPADDRLAIANMTTEWGALSGLFPIDSVLQS